MFFCPFHRQKCDNTCGIYSGEKKKCAILLAGEGLYKLGNKNNDINSNKKKED